LAILATKSLTKEQNDAARDRLRALLKTKYSGESVAFAKALGISQPFLSEVLSGKKGVGGKVLTGLAKLEKAETTAGSPAQVDTLEMARTATERIAEVLDLSPEEVWPDFLQPFPKYQGERWDVPGMVRVVSKITRQRLKIAPENARAGKHALMAAEPGPHNLPPKKGKKK
jgi:transcriptional regulator with XRE-family HTH domain